MRLGGRLCYHIVPCKPSLFTPQIRPRTQTIDVIALPSSVPFLRDPSKRVELILVAANLPQHTHIALPTCQKEDEGRVWRRQRLFVVRRPRWRGAGGGYLQSARDFSLGCAWKVEARILLSQSKLKNTEWYVFFSKHDKVNFCQAKKKRKKGRLFWGS